MKLKFIIDYFALTFKLKAFKMSNRIVLIQFTVVIIIIFNLYEFQT